MKQYKKYQSITYHFCVPHPFSPDKEPQRIPLTQKRIAERMAQAKTIQIQKAIRQQLRERS